MLKLFALISGFVLVTVGAQQYAAFDAASASNTYSAGNLAGSPAFAAQQALSAGSGYWCSSGGHTAGQSVTWTGVLNSRRVALGLKVDWAYAPGEIKILTSSDGANFEEAKCWQSNTRAEVAFDEAFMFDVPRHVEAVSIVMRGLQPWGYFGINSAALIVEPGPFMLVSGITSLGSEQCLVAGALGMTLEPCLEAVAAGDGREVMKLDEEGNIVSMADGTCMMLADGDTAGGGVVETAACSNLPDSDDGRAIFSLTPSGQLKMPRLGNVCLTVVGEGTAAVDIAHAADIVASSTGAQHNIENIVDGDAQSYWSSASDPVSPVDVQFSFGAAQRVTAIEIDWEHPAQAYELQVAADGQWKTIYSTLGNNLQKTKYVGPAVSAAALRIRMAKPHPTLGRSGGHALYAIKGVSVLATSSRAIVQDCAEAEGDADARDKFFMVAVPAFDASAGRVAKQQAALLGAAQDHLGGLLAELLVAMPSLASCGFKASFGKRLTTTASNRGHLPRKAKAAIEGDDATSFAIAAVTRSIGIDTRALQTLVRTAQETLAQIA